jgi:hypothetical protein
MPITPRSGAVSSAQRLHRDFFVYLCIKYGNVHFNYLYILYLYILLLLLLLLLLLFIIIILEVK